MTEEMEQELNIVVTRTPYRLSFFGGGTDYPDYYREHGGAVLSTSINRYCYITCREMPPFFPNKYLIRCYDTENVMSLDEIKHDTVRESIRLMGGPHEWLEVNASGDIPAMSGIGSSSAFTVGFLHALHAYSGQMPTKRQLAEMAHEVEQNMVGENVGSQDQVAAAFGGMNLIEFNGREEFIVRPVTLGRERRQKLQDRLLLYYTGISRLSSDIAGEQIKRIDCNTTHLEEMKDMVMEAVRILTSPDGDIDDFGRLMHESWMRKRTLCKGISSTYIDSLYEKARKHGALGGKICGAGGGGFLMLYVQPEKREAVMAAMDDMMLVPFRFETLGSHVIFYSS